MPSRSLTGALLGLIAAPILALASPALADDGVTSFTLDNGMDVVVIEDSRTPAVTHMVWYRVGSADEPEGVSGVAHFLEHLMFKATDNLETGELSRTVSANGGRDNAFTSYDYTAYFQRVAADRLGLMMEMEADRMVNLRFNPTEIESERGVVIEERNQRTDSDPGSLFNEQRRAAQFLNHRYGIPIIGWRHEIEEISQEDLQGFYDAHYAPNNAILVVAGNVSPDEVRSLAQEHYGVIPASPDVVARDRPQEPPQLVERRMVMKDDRVSQPYVARTYLAPERDPGDQETAAALTYLARILGGSSATSVLGQELEFKTGQAVYTSAFYRGVSLDDTTFGLIAVPSEGISLQEIEDAVDSTIAQFMQDGVDPAKFERIKTQIKASEIYGRDSVQSRAQQYGAALTSGLTVEDVQAWPEVLAAVTPEDVMAAAEMVFDRSNAVTGWLMPDDTQDTQEEVTQ
ncbi:M16 family metallopeptidase [Shimia ponticola]|uniref:M16 family metallopeptidase n=1 Tax=Shimia ponticola TaxID=2582893 RepID=UPI0011BF3EDD|nr:pitrilysin family protein [Shimia ponticola]